MTTNDPLEHYLTLLAWIVNNGIWNTLVSTGLFAAALAAIIVSEWMDARAQGADEGNKGVLSVLRVENRMYVAYLVIIFACVPLLPVNIGQLRFDGQRSQECGLSVAAPEKTAWGDGFASIGNKTAKVPVWWVLVHVLSKGITASATAAIPCFPDIRGMANEVDNIVIESPILQQEVVDFYNECYAASRARMFREAPELPGKVVNSDVGWIGSAYFLNEKGYYDSIQSKNPRALWPYNKTRDEARPDNGAGYPLCKDWWDNKSIGLRARLVKAFPTESSARLWNNAKRLWGSSISQRELEDAVIRKIVSPSHQAAAMPKGEYMQDYGGSSRDGKHTLSKATASVGAAFKSLSFFPSITALRSALPMLQAFLIMGLIISLPLIMVLSTYNLKVAMMTSFGLFTLHFMTFWWELARWIDSSVFKTLYGEPPTAASTAVDVVKDVALTPTIYGLFKALEPMASGESLIQQLMNFVMSGMFLILPALFFVAMSWAGYAMGRGMDGILTGGAAAAQKAGEAGGNFAVKAGKMVATRGMSKGK